MLRPMGNRCLVKRTEEETKLPSGIVIPNTCREKPVTAVVIAVGSKCENIKQGDKVMYGKYAGTEVTLKNEKYLIISEEEVLGVLEV